jgi:hypothetical protein
MARLKLAIINSFFSPFNFSPLMILFSLVDITQYILSLFTLISLSEI